MAANVVCISRAIFTGAENIASDVAKELGFRYVDEEIVEKAAQKRNLTAAEVASEERRKSFLRQFVRDLGESSADVIKFVANSKTSAPSDDMRELIRDAIKETAQAGNAVIVAHAASYALARRKGVLRVLITGSEFSRVQRWLPTSGGKSPREAEESIRDSDDARANYLKRFYDVKYEAPDHYDLTLSTDSLPAEEIKEIIVRAARTIE